MSKSKKKKKQQPQAQAQPRPQADKPVKQAKKAQKAWPEQKPRRYTPNQSKRVSGWMMVLGVLIAIVAIQMKSTPVLLIAAAEWLVTLGFYLWYWRCPVCGKSLPKTGKITECPRCKAKID